MQLLLILLLLAIVGLFAILDGVDSRDTSHPIGLS